MKHSVINIHSVFEKTEEKYTFDSGKETVSELLNFKEEDIVWVLENRADYFII